MLPSCLAPFQALARMICGLIFDLSAQFTDAQGEWMEVFLLVPGVSKGCRFRHFTDPKTGKEQDSHHEVLLMVQNLFLKV